MDPLDISRNPSKEKGKKIISPSVISFSSSSSNDNEAPYFLEFYDELSDSEDLTKAQREKRGMFKCLNHYVGTITNEEQPNERTPSPPPRKKSLSPPQAPSKSISSKSTHYTSSSSPSESPTPTHVAPPPKIRFVISIKQEPQELPPLQISPNDPYAQTMDNWPPGPSNPSLPRRSNPSVLVDKTKSGEDGLKTAHTDSGTNKKSRADDISKKIKLEDFLEFLKGTRYAFFTLDSPQDDPIIVTDESEEEEADKEDTHDASHDMPEDTSVSPPLSLKSAQIQELMAQARPSYPNINQLTTLLVTSLKPELSKILASHNFSSYLPTELKDLPSKFIELSGEIKELK
ncbi:hypothetical protein Tco_0209478 [Tanacetum coccineum]